MTPEMGDNSINADRLRSVFERIERLEEDRKAVVSDIKDIYMEAKSAGFEVRVLRQLIKLRAMNEDDVVAQETMLDIYRLALGGI